MDEEYQHDLESRVNQLEALVRAMLGQGSTEPLDNLMFEAHEVHAILRDADRRHYNAHRRYQLDGGG